jgi:hypothetical protein
MPDREEMRYIETEVLILNKEYKVLISIGDKIKTLERARSLFKNVQDEDCDDKRGCYWSEHGKHPLIWIGLTCGDAHFYATVAHEAVHAIQHIFDEIGETHSKEIFAHCVGAVVSAVEEYYADGWVESGCTCFEDYPNILCPIHGHPTTQKTY